MFNAYLLRPLPFPAADRLVLVSDTQPNYGYAPASFGEFEDWTRLGAPFDAVAALTRTSRTYDGEYPERIRVALVSERFFELTAPRVVAGRWFSAAEQQEGSPGTTVLLEPFRRSRLGGDRAVIGSTIHIDGSSVIVVGVIDDLPQLWAGDPIVALHPLAANAPWRDRGTHYLSVWARLQRGVTLERAQERLDVASVALQQERATDHAIGITPLRDLLIGDTRPLFTITLITVVLVLIIACTNVANLMLARTAQREQEFALRAALGAGRPRILRQLLVEGLVLSLLGGAAGLVVGAFVGALFLGDALRSQLFEIAPTDGAAYFTAVMTLFAAAALAAYIPARRVLRIDPLHAMRAN